MLQMPYFVGVTEVSTLLCTAVYCYIFKTMGGKGTTQDMSWIEEGENQQGNFLLHCLV